MTPKEQIKALSDRGILPTFHKMIEYIAAYSAVGDIEGLELLVECFGAYKKVASNALDMRVKSIRN